MSVNSNLWGRSWQQVDSVLRAAGSQKDFSSGRDVDRRSSQAFFNCSTISPSLSSSARGLWWAPAVSGVSGATSAATSATFFGGKSPVFGGSRMSLWSSATSTPRSSTASTTRRGRSLRTLSSVWISRGSHSREMWIFWVAWYKWSGCSSYTLMMCSRWPFERPFRAWWGGWTGGRWHGAPEIRCFNLVFFPRPPAASRPLKGHLLKWEAGPLKHAPPSHLAPGWLNIVKEKFQLSN